MTTGEKLKKDLGLSKMNEVRMLRILGIPLKVFVVYFNSQLKNIPITTSMLRKSFNYFNLSRVQNSKLDSDIAHTPLMSIEDFNGDLKGAIILNLDLIGLKYQKKSDFKYESLQYIDLKKLRLDELTINDFKTTKVTSDFTDDFIKQRRKSDGTANRNTKLIETVVDGNDVTFKFLTEATTDGKKKQQVDIETKELSANTSKLYEIWLKFPDGLELLDLQDKETINRSDIVALLEAGDVQFASSSASFLFQGFQYWLTQLDSAIVPENRKPERWDKQHGQDKVFLDKHTSELISQIGFFEQNMASQLQSELIKQGRLLTAKQRKAKQGS